MKGPLNKDRDISYSWSKKYEIQFVIQALRHPHVSSCAGYIFSGKANDQHAARSMAHDVLDSFWVRPVYWISNIAHNHSNRFLTGLSIIKDHRTTVL